MNTLISETEPSGVTEAQGRKVQLSGTHRARLPHDTWARIEPVLPKLGITRVADVTWLDSVGMPVWQAVRPNARLLSVSQGKGTTHILAKVSAAMESIESWHAENLPPTEQLSTVRSIADELPYQLSELHLATQNFLNPGTLLEWIDATDLVDGAPTLVPCALVRLDGRVTGEWFPPLFHASSNGLASGNTWEEAALHALYEVIERDAMTAAATGDARVVANDTVCGLSREILDQLLATGAQVVIAALDHPTAVSCFGAQMRSPDFDVSFDGYGAHLDTDVALCRALSEAAQSRVTAIAGTRDDVGGAIYRRATPFRGTSRREVPATGRGLDFSAWPSEATPSLVGDLALVVSRLVADVGTRPLMVDLTRPEIGVPVVKVIAPKLRCPEEF